MKRIYKETLDKIRASDEAKSETVARMREKLAEKKIPFAPSAKKRLTAVASAVCVVVLCIAVPLGILRAGSRDEPGTGTQTPPDIGVYTLGRTYTREDGSSVTFTGIRGETILP